MRFAIAFFFLHNQCLSSTAWSKFRSLAVWVCVLCIVNIQIVHISHYHNLKSSTTCCCLAPNPKHQLCFWSSTSIASTKNIDRSSLNILCSKTFEKINFSTSLTLFIYNRDIQTNGHHKSILYSTTGKYLYKIFVRLNHRIVP